MSHAHADHFARHESVLCSEITATLLGHRFNQAENRTQALGFHVPLHLDGFRLRLLPAGHIPGSAMLHVTRVADNATLLYTGDFKTRRSRIVDAANFLNADTLVLETTFALPEYRFPNPMQVEASLMGFIHDCFADGVTPMLLAYSLGKTQEALAVLHENEIPALLHPAAAAMTRACREVGVPGLPEPVEFQGEVLPGHVIIAPPHALRAKPYVDLPNKRTAMLSGWALQPNSRFRYGVDAMIPLSDHADHPGLMECIQRVRPKRILTVHGFAREFAAELRSKGIEAWSAAGGDQLELAIQRPAQRSGASGRAGWHNRVLCPLADFSDLCRLIEQTGSRVSRIDFIANYLKSLERDEDLQIATDWLCMPSRPSCPAPLNARMLRHLLLNIPATREERYHEIMQVTRDEIATAVGVLQELPLHPEALTLAGTQGFLEDFTTSPPTIERLVRLSDRLLALHPTESETLLRLLTGDLRLDLDPGLIEDAVARAFGVKPRNLRAAARQGFSLGALAVQARQGALPDIAESAAESRSSPTAPQDTQLSLLG